MTQNFWMVKQEPESYSWSDFVEDGRAAWTGVRNFQARNNLRTMGKGDRVFFYHSGDDKAVVGIAKVEREAYADPTATEGDWSCVDLTPVKPLKHPVTLDTLKTDAGTKDMVFIKQSRLSVSPLTEKQFARILVLGGTKA